MRLIDADELIYFTLGDDEKSLRFVPSEFIEQAETIDAIPIEWILRYLFDHPIINYFDSMIQDWRKENEID